MCLLILHIMGLILNLLQHKRIWNPYCLSVLWNWSRISFHQSCKSDVVSVVNLLAYNRYIVDSSADPCETHNIASVPLMYPAKQQSDWHYHILCVCTFELCVRFLFNFSSVTKTFLKIFNIKLLETLRYTIGINSTKYFSRMFHRFISKYRKYCIIH